MRVLFRQWHISGVWPRERHSQTGKTDFSRNVDEQCLRYAVARTRHPTSPNLRADKAACMQSCAKQEKVLPRRLRFADGLRNHGMALIDLSMSVKAILRQTVRWIAGWLTIR
jgi:hypothetical protein